MNLKNTTCIMYVTPVGRHRPMWAIISTVFYIRPEGQFYDAECDL